MKKAVFLTLGMTFLLILGNREGYSQTYYNSFPQKLVFPGDTLDAVANDTISAVIRRQRENFALSLWVRTRGTTDTLLVTVQHANDNSTDTLNWVTLTAFGGTKVATGRTNRIYTQSPIASTDTTRFIGKFLRIRSDHRGVSTTVEANTDTSTFEIWLQEWGDKVE